MKCIVCHKNPVLGPFDTCEDCRKRQEAEEPTEYYETLSWDHERAQDGN